MLEMKNVNIMEEKLNIYIFSLLDENCDEVLSCPPKTLSQTDSMSLFPWITPREVSQDVSYPRPDPWSAQRGHGTITVGTFARA